MTIQQLISHSKVESFVLSLQLPYELSTSILKSEDDCHWFLTSFYKNNRRPTNDLLDFREEKIRVADVQLEDFLSRFLYEDMLIVFEETFVENFTYEDMSKIQGAIDNHKITLEQLFLNFKKSPNKKILKYVL